MRCKDGPDDAVDEPLLAVFRCVRTVDVLRLEDCVRHILQSSMTAVSLLQLLLNTTGR